MRSYHANNVNRWNWKIIKYIRLSFSFLLFISIQFFNVFIFKKMAFRNVQRGLKISDGKMKKPRTKMEKLVKLKLFLNPSFHFFNYQIFFLISSQFFSFGFLILNFHQILLINYNSRRNKRGSGRKIKHELKLKNFGNWNFWNFPSSKLL